MSKSLGTGIDPLELIDGGPRPPVYAEGGEFPAYGADALRFGLLASSSSQDVRFNEERVKQGRDLANKLWNASRLILLGVQEGVAPSPDHAETPEDRWILSRLERITERTTESLDAFELSAAALDLYDFFWSELCDWYLELAKPRLYDDQADRTAVSATLLFCLDRTLRLLHPLMPHVTEEIWSFLPSADAADEAGLLAVAEWPERDRSRIDTQAEELVGRCVAAVTELRRYRDEAGVKPSAVLPARFAAEGYDGAAAQVARLARLELSDSDGEAAAEVVVPGGAIQLLATADFDPGAVAARIAERRDKLAAEIDRLEAKLANDRFVERAPAAVVQGERDKLAGYRDELARLG
jgi:valyl-tRNA synthetase